MVLDKIILLIKDNYCPPDEVRTMEDEDTLVLTPEEKDKVLENMPKPEQSDDEDDDDDG